MNATTEKLATQKPLMDRDAERVRAVMQLADALKVCVDALSDIVNAADNGQPYTAAELAGFANTAGGNGAALLAYMEHGGIK